MLLVYKGGLLSLKSTSSARPPAISHSKTLQCSRHWLPAPPAENWQLERIVVLGAPSIGLLLITIGAMTLPLETPVLRWIGIPVLVMLLIPLAWFIIAVIPVPVALYPRWARQTVRWRRQYWSDVRRGVRR